MSEWIDEEEKERRERLEIDTNRDMHWTNKMIHFWQFACVVDLLLGALLSGTALSNLIRWWAEDRDWLTGGFLTLLPGAMTGFLIWIFLRDRGRGRALKVLRDSLLGVLKCENRNQLDHYQEQVEAALERL
jgi:hypothetical protein